MLKKQIAAAAVLWAASNMPATAQETLEEKAALCAACHGEDGVPVNPDAPIIWGQHNGYMYLQLRDYKSGFRKNEIMSGIAAEMTKEDMQAYAAYFSEKPWPRISSDSSEEDEKIAETMASAGLCSECHLAGFLGDGTIPRAGGQLVTYLERTMLEFKTRVRGNNPDKSTLIATYSDDQIKAMARYLASLQTNQ